MVELTDKCKKCLGCNLLELETFKGKYRCENFVDGGKTIGKENTQFLYR